MNACQKKYPQACYNLAILFETEGNKGKAREYYKQACDGKMLEACEAIKEL